MPEALRIFVGVMSFVFAGGVVVWGISVFLQCRDHRRKMDDLEGR